MTVDISLSEDRRHCELVPGGPTTLEADGVDALIARLIAARAAMLPAHPATFDPQADGGFNADTLLWDTAPDPSQRAVALGLHHPGLGWISLRLTRAQIEDLVTSFAFSLETLKRRGGTVPSAPAAALPLRRIANQGT